MANSLGYNAFAQSFMQGFSFVDQSFRSRRDEKRLDARIKEERDQRKFMRDMATDRNTRAQAQEDRLQEAFDQQQADRELQDEAAAVYSEKGPDGMSSEELRKYGRYSPRVQAELDKRTKRGEMAETARTLHDLRQGGGLAAGVGAAGQQPGVAGQQPGVAGQQPGVEAPQSAPVAAAAEAAETSQSLFAPNRGESSLEEVDFDEFRDYSQRYQTQGLWGQIKETVAGVGAHALDVVADINPVAVGYRGADAGMAALTGADETVPSADLGASFGGNLHVPADKWHSEEEIQGMDQAGRDRAMASNRAVVANYEQRAASINGTKLVPNITTVGSLADVGKQNREDAIAYQSNALNTFEAYVNDPTGSSLQAALEGSPDAGLAMYYEMRNTVEAVNPQLASKVDENMVPVMSDQFHRNGETIRNAPAGSLEQKRAIRKQSNLVETYNEIYDTQLSYNLQAGVTGGLKPGDGQRVQQLTAVVNNPNRPRPIAGAMPQARYNSALTVAGRISPNRRLNDKQIDALVTALDLKMIDTPTFESVLMTGSWPPGKDPNGIKTMMKGNDGYIYATTNSGGLQIIPTAKAGGKFESEEFTTENLANITRGVAVAIGSEEKMTPEISAAVTSFVVNNAALLRNTFTVNSEEQQLLMGHLIHNAYIAREHDIDENYGNWYGGSRSEDAPPLSEYVFNTDMRRGLLKDLANQTGKPIDLVQVPARIRESNFDHQAARNAIAEGELAHLGFMPGTENSYSPRDLEEITYFGLELQERLIQDQAQMNNQFPLPQR
jgi:hypothetical protein